MNKLTRKDRIINALIVVSVLVVGFVVWYLPPAIAYWRCSEVYKRYSRVEGVRATYIKDFRVNDTLTIGVTLLEATTDSGWATLMDAFVSDEMKKEMENCSQTAKVWTRLAVKGHSEIVVGSDISQGGSSEDKQQEYEMIAIDNSIQAIGIFHTNNMEELLAVHDYGYNCMVDENNLLIQQ